MNQYKILYFGKLKQERGLFEETIKSSLNDPKSLYEMLADKYGLSMAISSIRVAVNESFVSWDSIMEDDSTLAFMPPMAGG